MGERAGLDGATTTVVEPAERPDRRATRAASAPGRGPSLASIIGLASAVFAGLIGLRSISDNSFFTHLETGRLILESGLPRADPYSFTAAGTPWVVQSWLASVAFALAERAAGGTGIRLLTAVLIAATVGLVWRLTAKARTLLPRFAVTGLVIVVSSNFWTPRPLLIGLLLFAALLVLYDERRDPRWAVPIMWVWVNCHGSFPLGLVAIGAFTLGEALDHKPVRRSLRFLAWSAGGVLLGAVGPIGPQLLLFPATVLSRMEILAHVVEWQSPNFSQPLVRVFLVQIVVAVVALVRRPQYRVAVPLLVFVAAALVGVRNIPLASIVMVPGIAVGFRDLGSIRGRERGGVAVVAAAAVLLGMVLAAPVLLARPSFDLSGYPTDALVWMDQNGLGPRSVRVATQDTVGNSIELLEGPTAKVFLDDRYDMYPVPLMNDYLVLHAGAPGWDAVLRKYQIDCVLWSTTEPLPQLLAESPDWVRPYQDASFTVSCRRDLRTPASGPGA